MLKRLLILFIFLPVLFAHAQNNILTHIVKPGENITQIASLYKVKVKDIYEINNISSNTVIKAGGKLIIPMGGYIDKGNKIEVAKIATSQTTNLPFHIIQTGESLYKIAKDNNVSVEQLRTWNNLENDIIKIGDYIYFSQQKSKTSLTEPKSIITQEEVVKASLKKNNGTENQTKVIGQIIDNNEFQKPEKIISKSETISEKSENNVFEKQYKPSNKSVMGLCGTFKTISGWKDKKYYALMNDAENGSIVKVKLDNKFIYAKVLGPLPNVKDDASLMIRISNAAAAALGVNYDLFEVKVEK